MDHTWPIFTSIDNYLSRFLYMIRLWQLVLTFLINTTNCKKEFSIQNHIKSFSRCSLNINTLEALMKIIAMAKILVEFLKFEDTWERWMNMKDRRFQE